MSSAISSAFSICRFSRTVPVSAFCTSTTLRSSDVAGMLGLRREAVADPEKPHVPAPAPTVSESVPTSTQSPPASAADAAPTPSATPSYPSAAPSVPADLPASAAAQPSPEAGPLDEEAPTRGRPAPRRESYVAEIWVDPDWYEVQETDEPMPSVSLPATVVLGPDNLIGRASASRNIHPEVDCGVDSGVSRRQARLSTDGTRWYVEDLGSANGTFVGPAAGPLPTTPIQGRYELGPDDRVYVGAWTRVVVRKASKDEVASLS